MINAEIERLTMRLSDALDLLAEAEAQRDRLKEALHEITHAGSHPLGWKAAEGIARAAIEECEK